jgi:hypothetical protein
MGTQQLRLDLVNSPRQTHCPGDRRHHRVVAIVTDAHFDFVLKIDALDMLQEAMHEVLA